MSKLKTAMALYLLIIPALFLAFPSMTAAAEAKPKPLLKVGVTQNAPALLLAIGLDQKFFSKEGVDIEVVPFTGSSDGLNALNTQKIDVGLTFGTGAPLTFMTKGADLIIIGGHVSGGHPVIAPPEKAKLFKTIQDFKGKKVAVPRLYTPDIFWRMALVKAGIDPAKDLEILEMKSPHFVLEAVKSGKVDVGIGAQSIFLSAKESGLSVVFWSNDWEPNHVCCRAVVNRKGLEAAPKDYEAFLRGLILAEKFFNENPEKSVAITKDFLKVREELARDLALEPHSLYAADPDKKGVLTMYEGMKKIGYLQSDMDVSKRIIVSHYDKALTELSRRSPDDIFYKKLRKRFEQQNL